MARSYTAWTAEQDALLRRLWLAGVPQHVIAAQLQRKESTLRWRVHALGMEARHDRKAPWTPEEDARLLDAGARKLSRSEVAAFVGRAERPCRERYARLIGRPVGSTATVAPAPAAVESPALRVSELRVGDPISWGAITLRGTPFEALEMHL